MSKTIITVVIIIIVLGLGYWLYQSTLTPEEEMKKEETKDEILVLLEGLNKKTGVNFSGIESVEMKWVVEVDPRVQEITIGGKGFEANRISTEQYNSIERFLKDNGFEIDLYNIASGTVAELTGYKNDQIVCTVAGGATGYKEAEGQWIPPEPDIKDIEIKCGRLEQPIGGQRDEYGCLGPAGYEWNEEASACIRGWELTENQRKAARIAVDYVGYEKGLTIIQVLVEKCPGCFMVEIEKGKNRIEVTLEDFKVVKKSLTPDECIAIGGETVTTTGGATCSESQLNIGEVTGFISPAICCVGLLQ